MDRETVKALAQTTTIYIILLIVLVWFLHFQVIFVPIPFEDGTFQFDPSFVLFPIISLSTFKYASKVLDKILVGYIKEILTTNLNRIGIASFIWLLTLETRILVYLGSLGFFALQPIGFIIFVGTMIAALHSTLTYVLREYNQIIAETLLTSLAIFAVGVLTSRSWLQIYQVLAEHQVFPLYSPGYQFSDTDLVVQFYAGLSSKLDKMIFFCATLTSAFSLMGVFKYHSNPYLSYLGGRLDYKLANKFFLGFLLFLYLLFLRGYLTVLVGGTPQIITVLEWGVVCLTSYLMYRSMKHYVSDSLVLSDMYGQWVKHLQEIAHFTDNKFNDLSELMDGFIQRGEKDMLLIYLVDFLRRYKIPIFTVTFALTDLINHRDRDVGVTTFTWQLRMLNNQNIERRREVLTTVLDNIRTRTNLDFKASEKENGVESNTMSLRELGSEIIEVDEDEN